MKTAKCQQCGKMLVENALRTSPQGVLKCGQK